MANMEDFASYTEENKDCLSFHTVLPGSILVIMTKIKSTSPISLKPTVDSSKFKTGLDHFSKFSMVLYLRLEIAVKSKLRCNQVH